MEVGLSCSASGVSLVNCTVTNLSDEKRENMRECLWAHARAPSLHGRLREPWEENILQNLVVNKIPAAVADITMLLTFTSTIPGFLFQPMDGDVPHPIRTA